MPRIVKPLGALEVKRLAEPGMHAVGTVPGLHLAIKASGTKSWVLRTTIAKRRADVGLGGFPGVTLADAHQRARDCVSQIRAGGDPIADRRTRQESTIWTFDRCAAQYMQAHRAGWKSAKHAAQWESTLATYASPTIGAKHVRDVNLSDVLAIIEPHWSAKNETANRVRNRIELVLSWAAARGLRDKINPAAWRGNLDALLPASSKVQKAAHHPALAIDDLHPFMGRLRAAEGMGARCLEFVILTACRSGEARGATWGEIDLDGATWLIPAERMKAPRAHRVPLSDRAVTVLLALPRFVGTELVFPGHSVEKPLSDMTLTAIMRRMGQTAVPHGFRSTFRDWASERTSYPGEVCEMALAHAIGNDTEAAYRRGDLFDKRRHLMRDWATFIDTPPSTGGNVVQLRSAA